MNVLVNLRRADRERDRVDATKVNLSEYPHSLLQSLHWRALHIGGVPLSLKKPQDFFFSVHSDFLSQQLALWLRAVKLERAVRCFLLAVIEQLSRMLSPGAGCVSLCLATQETGITSGPPLRSGRQREVNSPNDDRLANGPIRRGLGVKMASCSSGERRLKMEAFHDL